MFFSIIIATKNRSEQLRACLDQLGKLDLSDHAMEVIVVDNGSTDDTAAVVNSFAAEVPFAVSLLQVPQPAKTRALNTGIMQARGETLIFIDDDCYCDSRYLIEAAAVLADPQIMYFGGRILLHDPDDHPITIRTDTCIRRIEPYDFVGPGLIQGANMAVRRKAIDLIHGFDCRLGAGTRFACEDMDVATRLAETGCAGGYFPAPLVYHHHGRKTGPDVEQLKRFYARGSGAHFAKSWLRHRGHPRYLVYLAKHMARQCLKKRFRNIFWNIVGFGEYLLYRLRLGRHYEVPIRP